MILRRLFPWTGARMWRELAHVSLDPVSALVCGVVIIVLGSVLSSVAWLVLPLIPVGWLTFATSERLGRLERSRAAVLLDLPLPSPHRPLDGATRWARMRERLTSRSRWSEFGYLTLLPFLAIPSVLVLVVWSSSVMLLAMPLYLGRLAGGEAQFGLFTVGPGAPVVGAAVVGFVGVVLLAPLSTVTMAELDRKAVRRLLGPSETAALTEAVRRAETRRSVAVESAESERARIERDLHDGAQQRLVALAMDLGRAREQFDRDPEHAKALVTNAHEEAKAALVELRDLVRGIHPAVLADRGLDAALSAVVARVDIPVKLDVQVPHRPPSTVESTAYFVVTEALTNVARHSAATHAHVSVTQAAGKLVIEVSDNGIGGADPARGSGLSGLAGRVESLGGWLQVVSPVGGPTTLWTEIPCA